MSNGNHAVVWVNHSEAKVYRFNDTQQSEADVHAHTSLQRLHHSQAGWEAGGNAPDDTEFFGRINGALEHSEGTVITGPGNAKSALKAFLDHVRPDVVSHVMTVDTSEGHPGAGSLIELGRSYFGAAAAHPPQS